MSGILDKFPGPGDARLVPDPRFGFLKVEPMPTLAEISTFFETEYFAALERTRRAPDVAKLMSDDAAAAAERRWLDATMHADVAHAFRKHAPGHRVLDAGCGSGALVAYLAKQGFDVEGFDPSLDSVRNGKARGLSITHATLEQLGPSIEGKMGSYDGVALMNVLSCVPDAPAAISTLRRCLKPGGILYVRVGNQFNVLQMSAQKVLSLARWWVVVPDHLNYFNRESLTKLLDGSGFEVVDCYSDFPMEMFLVMGDNYIADPQVGAACHAKRVKFEMALDPEQRRDIYRGFAEKGLGRCLHMIARAV